VLCFSLIPNAGTGSCAEPQNQREEWQMSKSAFSLLVFSIYIFALGFKLLFFPNLWGRFFGIPETQEIWIRVVAVLVLIIGYFDFMASGSEVVDFFRWSVRARLAVPVFFFAFVALGLAPPILILAGIIDAAGAVWTAACLRSQSSA
jgi:hypothetical protein